MSLDGLTVFDRVMLQLVAPGPMSIRRRGELLADGAIAWDHNLCAEILDGLVKRGLVMVEHRTDVVVLDDFIPRYGIRYAITAAGAEAMKRLKKEARDGAAS